MKVSIATDLLRHRDQRLLVATFWIFAVAGLIQSGLTRMHQGMTANWFSLSFYFIVPTVLWSFSLMAIRKIHDGLTKRMRLVQAVAIHGLISIVFAMVLKFVALWIDFTLQRNIGTMTGTFLHFMGDVQFLYVTSIVENVALYWFVVMIMYLVPYPGKVILNRGGSNTSSVIIRERDHETEVIPEQILFVEAFGNYLKIHLPETTVCVRGTIKSIEQQLSSADFFRVHRSFIVNRTAVAAVVPVRSGRYSIRTSNDKSVPTGKQFLPSVNRLQALLNS